MPEARPWPGLLALLLAGAALAQVPADLELTRVAEGFSAPLLLTHAGDGSERLFVVEQGGQIRIIKNGVRLPTPFLDIGDRVVDGGERGLLGLAFHPDYPGDPRFYVSYTATEDGQLTSRVSAFQVSGNPDLADSASETVLLRVPQPASNHNGGHLAFGPDGYLYIGFGDGGGSNDEYRQAQDLGTLSGSILRIDVDGTAPYAIPPDNPFVGVAGTRPEIWAYGLRNPWRFSFDRVTGDLWIGDVGQWSREEINLQPAASDGGENYGWPCREGDIAGANPNEETCPAPLTEPVLVYPRAEGRSVTGGYRYRGSIPGLQGVYVFGDFANGRIWFATPDNGGWTRALWEDTALSIASFGEDKAGDLYVVDYGGAVYRFVSPASGPILVDGFE